MPFKFNEKESSCIFAVVYLWNYQWNSSHLIVKVEFNIFYWYFYVFSFSNDILQTIYNILIIFVLNKFFFIFIFILFFCWFFELTSHEKLFGFLFVLFPCGLTFIYKFQTIKRVNWIRIFFSKSLEIKILINQSMKINSFIFIFVKKIIFFMNFLC